MSRLSPGGVPPDVPAESAGGIGIGGQNGTTGRDGEGRTRARARARERGPFSLSHRPILKKSE